MMFSLQFIIHFAKHYMLHKLWEFCLFSDAVIKITALYRPTKNEISQVCIFYHRSSKLNALITAHRLSEIASQFPSPAATVHLAEAYVLRDVKII